LPCVALDAETEPLVGATAPVQVTVPASPPELELASPPLELASPAPLELELASIPPELELASLPPLELELASPAPLELELASAPLEPASPPSSPPLEGELDELEPQPGAKKPSATTKAAAERRRDGERILFHSCATAHRE
jgi:hypothetical protein